MTGLDGGAALATSRLVQESGPRTSPSHLFLPFRQAVHARAPRFGMCDAGVGGCIDADDVWGECIVPFVLTLCVRRRLLLLCSSGVDDVGEWDIVGDEHEYGGRRRR